MDAEKREPAQRMLCSKPGHSAPERRARLREEKQRRACFPGNVLDSLGFCFSPVSLCHPRCSVTEGGGGRTANAVDSGRSVGRRVVRGGCH